MRPKFALALSIFSVTGSRPLVLQVIAPAPHGGAESVVLALAGAWHRAGGKGGVAVLMVQPNAHHFAQRLRAENVPVWEITGGKRAYLSEIRNLRALLRSSGADILHTHVYRADAVGYLASRRPSLPIVCTAHGFTSGDWKNRAYESFDRFLMRRFAAVSCVSPELVARLVSSGVSANRVRLIANSIGAQPLLAREAARRELDVSGDGALIGWVGRLSAEKAPGLFIEAISKTRSGCRGIIIGDGPLRREVEAAADAACSRVQFVGPRENAARLLRAFDALVLTSLSEGTPMILLEAMRAGVPIVSFSVGGVPALLGDTAMLVPPGNTGVMAAAIDELIANPCQSTIQAVRARSRLDERHGEAQWVRAHEELYALALR